MIGADGKPTDTYYAVQKVDNYLKSFGNIYGNYQYTSTYMINKCRVAGFKLGSLNCTNPDKFADITSSNGLLVGTFDEKNRSGNAYIITNMEELNNNVTAHAAFKVPEGKSAVLYQQGKTTEYGSKDKIKLTLTPGEGVFITVK